MGQRELLTSSQPPGQPSSLATYRALSYACSQSSGGRGAALVVVLPDGMRQRSTSGRPARSSSLVYNRSLTGLENRSPSSGGIR
jgi:hypothetical protein